MKREYNLNKIIWTIFIILYIGYFIWNIWVRRNNTMFEINFLLGSITSIGLIFYTNNMPLLYQIFWKVYFLVEAFIFSFTIVTLFVFLTHISSESISEINNYSPLVLLIGLFIQLIALYALWDYAYKSKEIWT